MHSTTGNLSQVPATVTNKTDCDYAAEINREFTLAEADKDLSAKHSRSSIEHFVRCGELLLAQKHRMGHGSFKNWISSVRTFS